MKAMVFAAGLGTRLKPLTDSIPKALIPVNGIPLLKYVVLKLKAAGVSEIIINIHHKGEQIIDFVHAENNFGIQVNFSDETGQLLDTGGGLKFASRFFDDDFPFFVHNVDILSNVNLTDFYRFHQQNGALASVFVSERKSNRYLLFDGNDHLKAWVNETSGEIRPAPVELSAFRKLAFNGIHVISPQLFRYMDTWDGHFSIIDFYLSIAQQCKIAAYCPQGIETIDVGKPDALMAANQFANNFYENNISTNYTS